MDHHANMAITHHCVHGVDVDLEFFTYEANALTEKDFDAARAVDLIHTGNRVTMSDYSYKLLDYSIAKHPASPRGSSKLLRVDGNGIASYFDHFAENIPSLMKGCHVVFNESRVLDARLYINDKDKNQVELMILDLGDVDLQTSCSQVTLRAMIRSSTVKEDDLFTLVDGHVQVKVLKVEGYVSGTTILDWSLISFLVFSFVPVSGRKTTKAMEMARNASLKSRAMSAWKNFLKRLGAYLSLHTSIEPLRLLTRKTTIMSTLLKAVLLLPLRLDCISPMKS